MPRKRKGPNARILVAIQKWAELVYGCGVKRVRVDLTDGGEARLKPPPGLFDALDMAGAERRTAAAPESEWPPSRGWAFRPGLAAFDGVPFKLSGIPLRLLEVLAERPGEPVTADALRQRVWPRYAVDDGTVRSHVSTLRKRLKQALNVGDDAEPVENSDGAYTLTLC